MKKPAMSMWVFKEYRDRHPRAIKVGNTYIRYFGRVDGESYVDCLNTARRMLGPSNRGRLHIVWKWNKGGNGAIGRFKQLSGSYQLAEECADLTVAGFMIRKIDSEPSP